MGVGLDEGGAEGCADRVGTAVGRRVNVGGLDAVGRSVGTGVVGVVVGRRVRVFSAVVVGANEGRNETVVGGEADGAVVEGGDTSTVEGAGECSRDMEKEASWRKKAQSSSRSL